MPVNLLISIWRKEKMSESFQKLIVTYSIRIIYDNGDEEIYKFESEEIRNEHFRLLEDRIDYWHPDDKTKIDVSKIRKVYIL